MNEINKLKQYIFNQESINKNMEDQLKNLESNKILMERKNKVIASNGISTLKKKNGLNLYKLILLIMFSFWRLFIKNKKFL